MEIASRIRESLETHRKPVISPEEYEAIQADRTVGMIYKVGLLVTVRKAGVSLKEALQFVMSEPGQAEHRDAFRRARVFFEKNADIFGLKVDNI